MSRTFTRDEVDSMQEACDVDLWLERAALRRIARILLAQVERGGPSNFADVAGHFLATDDLPIFKALVVGDGD